MIRLLVVDDHPDVRDGIVGMMAADEDVTVVGEASGGAEAVGSPRRWTPTSC